MALITGVTGADFSSPRSVVNDALPPPAAANGGLRADHGDVRQDLRRLTRGNRIAEAVATYFTGKPAQGERPLVKLSPLQLHGLSTLTLAGSVGATYAALAYAPVVTAAIVPYLMLWTVGRLARSAGRLRPLRDPREPQRKQEDQRAAYRCGDGFRSGTERKRLPRRSPQSP